MADKRPISLYSGHPQELGDGDKLVVNGPLGTVDYIDFDVTATVSGQVGRLRYNNVDGTLEFTMAGGNVTQQIGQELPIPVKHADNSGLTNGLVVYQAGSNGENILVRYAQANSEAASSKVFGVLTESASGAAPAFCTTFGIVRDLDTSTLTEGAAIWLSPTVAGGLTTTKPVAPDHLVFIGLCIRSHAVEGKIFVNPQNGYELEELHNVLITVPLDGHVLSYDAATGLWKNTAPSGGGGGVTFTTSETAPASPSAGDEWLDSLSGIKYTYVNDGTSSQWVELESKLSFSQSSGGGSASVYSNEYSLTGSTTNATETEIFVGGVANARVLIPLNKTVYYTADIVCRRTDSAVDHAAFYVKGVATNVAGVVTDVGLLYEVNIARTDATFAVDFRADDTTDSLNVYVTGNAGKTLQWKCAITALEV